MHGKLSLFCFVYYSLVLCNQAYGLQTFPYWNNNRLNKPKGPNECGYRWGLTVCCEGWRKNIKSKCLIPICGGYCGERGECIRPDVCKCHNGKTKYDCSLVDEEETTYIPYNPVQYDQPLSFDSYNPKRAICYLSLNRGICSDPLGSTYISRQGSLLSQEECCNSIGVAWGSPCQDCDSFLRDDSLKLDPNEQRKCSQGTYYKDGRCIDIDECQMGACNGGRCQNIDGSYRCTCDSGYDYNSATKSCEVQKDYCERYPKTCSPNGSCQSLGQQDYRCLCNAGYQLSTDMKYCMKNTNSNINLCSIYKGRLCKHGRCMPRGSSYECECDEGYRLSQDRKTCMTQLNVCNVFKNSFCENGFCIPRGDTYTCRCNVGFTLSADEKQCIRDKTSSKSHGIYVYSNQRIRTPTVMSKFPSVPRPRKRKDSSSSVSFSDRIPQQDSRTPACSIPQLKAKCQGGVCLNLGGRAYMCECKPGFKVAERGRSCVSINKEKRSPFDNQPETKTSQESDCQDCMYGCDKGGKCLCPLFSNVNKDPLTRNENFNICLPSVGKSSGVTTTMLFDDNEDTLLVKLELKPDHLYGIAKSIATQMEATTKQMYSRLGTKRQRKCTIHQEPNGRAQIKCQLH